MHRPSTVHDVRGRRRRGLLAAALVAGVQAAAPGSEADVRVVPLPPVARAEGRAAEPAEPRPAARLPAVPWPFARGAAVEPSGALGDVRQINVDGFGSAANRYAFSMAVFNGDLYVGTLNVDSMQGMLNFFWCRSARDVTRGAEIWRLSRGGWTRVVAAGLASRLNLGVRKLAVIDGSLYAVTANHDEGMEVWRTRDGTRWERVADRGFGEPANTSGRGLASFRGSIYVGTENRRHGAQLWRSRDGDEWEKVGDRGLGDEGNAWLSDFAVFQDRLYMGTLNTGGMQLLRTADGSTVERVTMEGVDTRTDIGAIKLCVFKGRLFVGTMDFVRGCDLHATPDGITFTRVLGGGFNDPFNAYVWQLQEYDGRLYAGTYRHSLTLPTGSFTLLSSADGDRWAVESDDAFGHSWHYGARTMAVLDDRLIIGTASARYGCKVLEARAR